jgi:hypothetical protein
MKRPRTALPLAAARFLEGAKFSSKGTSYSAPRGVSFPAAAVAIERHNVCESQPAKIARILP